MPYMDLIYQEISQANAAKNDDATANTRMWDDSMLAPPKDFSNDWKLVGRKDMTTDMELLQHELRSAQHHVFKTNVKRSFENNMST